MAVALVEELSEVGMGLVAAVVLPLSVVEAAGVVMGIEELASAEEEEAVVVLATTPVAVAE